MQVTISNLPVWSSKMPIDQQAELEKKYYFTGSIDPGDEKIAAEFLRPLIAAETPNFDDP